MAGLLSLACSEPCLAQWQTLAPVPTGSSWLPSALQPYNPTSGLNNLLPSLKGTKPGGKAQLQQRTYPFRPGNNPTAANKPKRNLKVGPCALPFMENCVVGPYVSAAFSISSNNGIGASASSTTSYTNVGGIPNFNVASTSNNSFTTGSSSTAGADFSVGYDLGGIRTELNYAFTTGSTSSTNLFGSGTDLYVTTGFANRTDTNNASATISPLSFTRQSLLFNTAIDIPTGTRLIPYFGGGIGAAWLSIGSINQETSDLCVELRVGTCPAILSTNGGTGAALAAQAKAGLSYLINLRTIMFIEAVYDYTGAVTIGNLNLNSFSQYSGKLGVRYRF
ncbi:MAG: P44/Msp2 family outer membrane protein [Prochlorococcaceae cyanobacterium]